MTELQKTLAIHCRNVFEQMCKQMCKQMKEVELSNTHRAVEASRTHRLVYS